MTQTAEEVIRLCANALGSGFKESVDREGWAYRCTECGQTQAGNDGDHLETCTVGLAVKAVEEFLYD